MIKILKDGTKRKVKCNVCGGNVCGAVLRFDESDIKSELVGYGYCGGFVGFIRCPQCGHKIIL